MSTASNGPADGDRRTSVEFRTYDCHGRLIAVQEATSPVYSYVYDGTGTFALAPPEPQAEPAVATPTVRHGVEFRLCGSEVQQRRIAVAGQAGDGRIVAIERVRAFLTGDGAAGSAASAIGGIEVHAELEGGEVVCTAQLSDFAAGNLVVVQVDIAIHSCEASR